MTQLLQNFSNHFSNLPWATQFAMLGIFAFAFGLVVSSFFVRRAIGPMVEDDAEHLWFAEHAEAGTDRFHGGER